MGPHPMRYVLTAYVYQGGKVIAQAENLQAHGTLTGSQWACGYSRSVHAEQRAARLARGKLARRPWGVLVVRYRKDGSRGMSKPCILCSSYLAGAGCSWVDYYDGNGHLRRMTLN